MQAGISIGPLGAAWWGYAEANPTLVGIVVVIITVAALAYIGRRWWRK
jgi:hypothetical protein